MPGRIFGRNRFYYCLCLLFCISPAAYARDITCDNFTQVEAEQLVQQIKWQNDSTNPPTPGCSSDSAEAEKCDWSNAVVRDRVAPGRRLIIVDANHETGSGEWDYVTVYGCRKGEVGVLFANRYLYGAAISKFTPAKIVLTSEEWRENDPLARASHEKIEAFAWDPKSESYRRSGRVVRIAREQ